MFTIRSGRVAWFWLAPILFSTGLAAQDHVVPLEELRRQAVAAGQKRQADLTAVSELLAMEPVQQALQKGRLDAGQVRQAAALLSDSELSQLAARATKLRADVEAGALNNQQLTYIVIALGTAVIILVIVAA